MVPQLKVQSGEKELTQITSPERLLLRLPVVDLLLFFSLTNVIDLT